MQFTTRTANDRTDTATTWHQFFVVWPREIEPGKWIAFERVWRRAIQFTGDDKDKGRNLFFIPFTGRRCLFFWEYKTNVFEFLKENGALEK